MPAARLRRLLLVLGWAVVLRVVAGMLATYPGYLPAPDFRTEFLTGREETFFVGGYRTAFVAHILAGPPTLLLGLLLASPALWRRAPRWHRLLGRIEVALAVLIVAPSGLVMAWHPLPWLPTPVRRVAGLGFGALAILTAVTALLGLLAARDRRIADHERWMTRLLALLLSAIVLRLIGGVSSVLCPEHVWSYGVAAWASWVGPLLVVEIWSRAARSRVSQACLEECRTGA